MPPRVATALSALLSLLGCGDPGRPDGALDAAALRDADLPDGAPVDSGLWDAGSPDANSADGGAPLLTDAPFPLNPWVRHITLEVCASSEGSAVVVAGQEADIASAWRLVPREGSWRMEGPFSWPGLAGGTRIRPRCGSGRAEILVAEAVPLRGETRAPELERDEAAGVTRWKAYFDDSAGMEELSIGSGAARWLTYSADASCWMRPHLLRLGPSGLEPTLCLPTETATGM